MVSSRPPAVDKLLAEKVLVPNIQAAEDLNLWPFMTAASSASEARSLQHAPHQPSDLMLIQLIVPPVRWMQTHSCKSVAAKVKQVTGQFPPKELENWVLLNII